MITIIVTHFYNDNHSLSLVIYNFRILYDNKIHNDITVSNSGSMDYGQVERENRQ